MEYWRRVFRRAWQEARKTAKIETTKAVVTQFAGQIVLAALLWYLTGDANLWTRLATTVTPFLLTPVIFAFEFVAAPRLLYAEAEEKVEALRAQMEQRARKIAVKDTLGGLIETGTELFRQAREMDVQAATEQWATRCRDLIKAAFGSGEASLFLDDSGYTFYVDQNQPLAHPIQRGEAHYAV